MLGADVLGFQAEQWAENFLLGARDTLRDARVDVRRRRVHYEGRTVLVRAYPVSLDPAPLRATSREQPEVVAIRGELEELREDAHLLVRVDRLDLSKNIVRGFEAFRVFLDEHPEWRERVPSSRCCLGRVPRCRSTACTAIDASRWSTAINDTFGTSTWTPVQVRTDESYARAVAAYGIYDVLFVNPIFDGMNLVAMEGPLVNRRQGSLILSRNAGAFARLGRHAIAVNPFDVGETAAAIAAALELPRDDRVRRSRGLVRAVLARNPVRWLTTQLRDLDASVARRASQRAPGPRGGPPGPRR